MRAFVLLSLVAVAFANENVLVQVQVNSNDVDASLAAISNIGVINTDANSDVDVNTGGAPPRFRRFNVHDPADRELAEGHDQSNTLVQTQVNVNDINQAVGFFTNVVNVGISADTNVDETGGAAEEMAGMPAPSGPNFESGQVANTVVQFQANVLDLNQALLGLTNVINADLDAVTNVNQGDGGDGTGNDDNNNNNPFPGLPFPNRRENALTEDIEPALTEAGGDSNVVIQFQSNVNDIETHVGFFSNVAVVNTILNSGVNVDA